MLAPMHATVPIVEPPLGGEPLCPRCGNEFHCGMRDATPCICSRLTLQASQLAALRGAYAGCLCVRCLQAVAEGHGVGPLSA